MHPCTSYFTVRNRSIATKHIFIGKTRLASKLSPGEGQSGTTTTSGSGFLPGLTGIFHRSDAANQNALNALKNPHLTGRPHPGQGLTHRSATANQTAQNVSKNPNLASGSGLNSYVPEGNFLYFYHPDHLGSTAYVTDGSGQLYEHMEYFPFGETWADQRSNTQRVPYLFTGKEYDEEVGLYYFGARYYDPRTSVWESADPAFGEYLDGQTAGGGIYRPININAYRYASLNPLRLVDPDGRTDTFNVEGKLISRTNDGSHNIRLQLPYRPNGAQYLNLTKKQNKIFNEFVGTVYNEASGHGRKNSAGAKAESAGIAEVVGNRHDLSGRSYKDLLENTGIYGNRKGQKVGDVARTRTNWHMTNARRAVIRTFLGERKDAQGAYFWEGLTPLQSKGNWFRNFLYNTKPPAFNEVFRSGPDVKHNRGTIFMNYNHQNRNYRHNVWP